MKDSRIGESLWSIWDGNGYNPSWADSIVYFTEEHIDVEHEVIRKALASSIQRDGITYSLFEGFKLIDSAIISIGWVGTTACGMNQEICNESGETFFGDQLDKVTPVTFVEVPELA